MDDIDVDGLLGEIESPSSGIPMTAPEETEAPAQQANQQAAPQEYEINWNGKQIKAPIDKLTKWASQGYDYAQRMEALKTQQSEFEQNRQQFEPKLNLYKDVDDYAAKNPDWWDHVQKSWQERQQAFDPSNPIANELNTLKSEIQELRKFKDDLHNEKIQEKRKAEDSALDNEIGEMRKAYADLDWASVDDNGMTLESRILQHATNNGINSFRAAFRDYNHDRLVEIAAMKAKEQAVKDRKAAAKAGLLGVSSTPRHGIQQAGNVRSKSYNDLTQEALKELGL
jgi:hypothetical protein